MTIANGPLFSLMASKPNDQVYRFCCQNYADAVVCICLTCYKNDKVIYIMDIKINT